MVFPVWAIGIGKWCLDNWKIVLAGLFAAWVGWLYWDNGQLRKEVQDLKLTIAKVIAENRFLTDASVAITRKYDHTLMNKWSVEQQLAKSEKERIANDKLLNALGIPRGAVRVFNAPGSDHQQAATKAVGGNDARTASTSQPRTETSGQGQTDDAADSGYTLADLLVAARENRSRLVQCIDTVKEWQQFWTDFVAAVNASEKVGPRVR